MNLEDLFDECITDEKYREPTNNTPAKSVDNLVKNIEAEFTGAITEYTEREKEKTSLSLRIKELSTQAKTLKNPQNLTKMTYAKRERITKKLADKRETVRNEISRCKVRLDEIEVEEGKTQNTPLSPLPQKSNLNGNTTHSGQNRERSERSIAESTTKQETNKWDKWNTNPYEDLF